MKHYIFTTRNGIHIIDLQKTRMKLENAYYAMKELAAEGKKVLFVGTKKQAQSAIEREASKCGMFFIAYRWPGGLLTNFDTVKRSITRLKDIEGMQEKGVYNVETKKERLELERESQKLNKVLKGIKDMHKLPDALFVIDPKRETIAIREAKKLRIPIFAVVDSNCDPEDINYPIPGNDDAIRAIVLFLEVISKAVISGVTGQDLELEEGESDSDSEASERASAARANKSREDDIDTFESDEMESSGLPAGVKASEKNASFADKEEKKSPNHDDKSNDPEKIETV
jgi:small subunit ribosomal protein S2